MSNECGYRLAGWGRKVSIMYTAKLFDDLFSSNPVMIIDDHRSKTLSEALQYAINKSADFNVPGFDAIIRIDMYNDGVYVDTIDF